MRNIFFLIVISLFFSCDKVEDNNNPGFQIFIDNLPWRAEQINAFKNPNGSIIIRAINTNERFEILVPSAQVRTYQLGNSSTVNASYTYEFEGVFLNYISGNGINNLQGPLGTLVIKRHPKADPDTISGELTFQGVQTTGNESYPEKKNFLRGTFYNIPLQTP